MLLKIILLILKKQKKMNEEKYSFSSPDVWAGAPSDELLKNLTQETDFSNKTLDEGRDICFYLRRIRNQQNNGFEEYSCVVYSLTQPKNLEIASVEDIYIDENTTVDFHRIAVIRQGELIDKTGDTKIKVFDDEIQSQGGVYNNSKKINISIRDLRLYDTIITERTIKTKYTEKERVRKDYMKYLFLTPEIYWGYTHYELQLLNNTGRNIAYLEQFFKDESGNVIPAEKKIILPGEKFSFLKTNYVNDVDMNREIPPFIDFATDADWKELSNFIFPLYEDIYQKSKASEKVPELTQKLDAIEDIEQKIKWAIEYVQNNIKYIYDSDEMNGHQPQEIAVTYATRQGDCKAKSVLLKSLLDYINVPAEIVVVNYRADFYLQYYLPSLLNFNHVIVKIKHNGNDYFVDPTAQEEYGTLENRTFIQFYHYLEVLPNQTLSHRQAYESPKFSLEETIDYHAKEDKGTIELSSLYRYNKANSTRNYFKNTNKREILDSWMSSLFYCLNFNNDRKIEDIRSIFLNPEISIAKDDKDANELTVHFKANLDKPYFTDKNNKRFMMFWDFNTLKSSVKDFNSKDATFWHGFESEKYTINLSTDHTIDTEEKYTKQENRIDNHYFSHEIKKKIHKNGGTAIIEYKPKSNLEVPLSEIQKLKEDYLKIDDSNFGLGIDIIEPGVSNFLKNKLSKWFK